MCSALGDSSRLTNRALGMMNLGQMQCGDGSSGTAILGTLMWLLSFLTIFHPCKLSLPNVTPFVTDTLVHLL